MPKVWLSLFFPQVNKSILQIGTPDGSNCPYACMSCRLIQRQLYLMLIK